MTIGKRIQSMRKDNNMSQDQLAQKCNVSRQTISRWENDEVVLDTNNLITLSKLFNKSLDEIVFGETRDEQISKPKKSKKLFITNIILVFILITSLILNGITIYDKQMKSNSIYGTWIYEKNGYEIRLTLIENEKDDVYDNARVYLYYQKEDSNKQKGYESDSYPSFFHKMIIFYKYHHN